MDIDNTLYPETAAFDRRRLDVGDGHSLYLEQVGRPGGIPALFLHGGPGSGCQPSQARLFDPARFRVVLLDQRGAGRSTPRRRLAANTTAHLVDDMERVREALGIARWMLVGGSWGALLATAYAEAHPRRVTAMVLRAVFLGRAQEVEWAFVGGPRHFYPELWRAFVAPLPAPERADPLRAYGARLTNPDPAIHVPAARLWHDFERVLSVLRPPSLALPASLEGGPDAGEPGRTVPNTPFVEWHYFSHDCFLEPDALLQGAGRLAGIPGIIVQGRYDLLCPPATAHALAARWPDCELRLVEAAGHSLAEPEILDGVVAAIDDLARHLD